MYLTKSEVFLCCWAVIAASCQEPAIDTGVRPSAVGGTIAGLVTAIGPGTTIVNRKITAIDVRTGSRYVTTTAVDGGYTIRVPEGTYHIELELRSSESLKKRPDNTHIKDGDLDPHRNFVIATKLTA